MNPVHIHHIETLTPDHSADQATIARHLGEWAGDPGAARMIRTLFARSGIARRHSVVPDFAHPDEAVLFRRLPDGTRSRPGTRDRMRVFRQHAGPMASRVASAALERSGRFLPEDVTHVVTVSCTGFENPGPDWAVVEALGLRPDVERYNLGFMGCYAALPALRMARQFCLARPDAVVLVVCLELCSLHMQMDTTPDALLGNALFSDGAAAVLVSARSPDASRPSFLLDGFNSAMVPEGRRDMAWEIGDLGFHLMLSSYVPDILGANVVRIVRDLLAPHGIAAADIDRWAIHPGGRAILDRIEDGLALEGRQVDDSRTVLRDHGNMSSATVLFVLRRMLESTPPGPRGGRIASLAFGPGLTIEGAVMTCVPASRPTTAPDRMPAAARPATVDVA